MYINEFQKKLNKQHQTLLKQLIKLMRLYCKHIKVNPTTKDEQQEIVDYFHKLMSLIDENTKLVDFSYRERKRYFVTDTGDLTDEDTNDDNNDDCEYKTPSKRRMKRVGD